LIVESQPIKTPPTSLFRSKERGANAAGRLKRATKSAVKKNRIRGKNSLRGGEKKKRELRRKRCQRDEKKSGGQEPIKRLTTRRQA